MTDLNVHQLAPKTNALLVHWIVKEKMMDLAEFGGAILSVMKMGDVNLSKTREMNQ